MNPYILIVPSCSCLFLPAQLLPTRDDEKGISINNHTGTSINLNIKDHTARYAKEHEKGMYGG